VRIELEEDEEEEEEGGEGKGKDAQMLVKRKHMYTHTHTYTHIHTDAQTTKRSPILLLSFFLPSPLQVPYPANATTPDACSMACLTSDLTEKRPVRGANQALSSPSSPIRRCLRG